MDEGGEVDETKNRECERSGCELSQQTVSSVAGRQLSVLRAEHRAA